MRPHLQPEDLRRDIARLGRGANNFAAFRRFIVAQTRTRLCPFIHIANSGLASFPVAELTNIDVADVSAAAKAIAENGDIVIGAKVRMSENVIAKNGIEPLKRAIAACEQAGTGGRVMVHIGGVETRAPDVADSRSDAARRCFDPCLFGRAEPVRRFYQYR
jgi:predicted amidohydrolase